MGDIKDVSHHEVAIESKKKRGCKGHCKRFWWVYLIIAIAVILLVVLLIIFVAVPKIIQNKLDDAELTIDSIDMDNSKPDNFVMAVNSTIRTDGKTHATISAFVGEMYLEDIVPKQPFATVDFPETTSDAEVHVNIVQNSVITDMDAFTTFNKWLMHNESLRVSVYGEPNVQAKGLARKYKSKFRKTVTIKGLNSFKGLQVLESHLNISAPENNFFGRVNLPNPTILQLDIGNTVLATTVNGTSVGSTYLDNLLLKRGDNDVPIRATIDQGPVLTSVQSQPNCQTGEVVFEMTGSNVTNQDGQVLTYFRDALSSSPMEVVINIGEALKTDVGIEITCPA